MKLFILRPKERLPNGENPWDPWYDKAFGFVVSANDEKEAIKIAHNNAGDENRGEFLSQKTANTKQPWLDKRYSTCKELVAKETGLVLRDFASAWKTFSYPTCKGLLKITAETREASLAIFKILARKNKRAEYVPVGRERMRKYKQMIYGN